VRHDTFYSLHEVFNKLNSYTTRLVKHQQIKPSLRGDRQRHWRFL
jgi:hypothetical protein